ncbi:MAG: hypothetical protein HYX41_06405 [Bdellovibrio sp.]|nr:hypothetical protein [Bdellovibrio sp.]
MKKSLVLSFFAGISILASGCATTGAYSPTGYAWISDHKDALLVTSKETGNKTGRACSKNILGFIALGDASVDAAKREGNITSVSSVDMEYTNIIGVYGSACAVVRGN